MQNFERLRSLIEAYNLPSLVRYLRFLTQCSVRAPIAKPLGRLPQPEADLLDEIKAVIGEMPTYGYRRVWAILRRTAETQGLQPPSPKRVYRIMKAHGLLLQRHAGGAD
ncbi:MAG: IS3 family transposase [Bradyrhizobium sp.]|nr:IS3 family transposase [Bradyrhizobium sp.]